MRLTTPKSDRPSLTLVKVVLACASSKMICKELSGQPDRHEGYALQSIAVDADDLIAASISGQTLG